MLAHLPRKGLEVTLGAAAGVGAGGLLAVGSLAYSPLIATAAILALSIGPLVALFAPGLVYILMAFAVPLERLGRFGDDLDIGSFSLMRLIGLGAFATALIQTLLTRRKIETPAPMVAYGLLCVLAFASILYADDPAMTRSRSITMLGDLFMLFVILQGVRDWRMIERMLLAWLAATLLIGLWQIYDWHFGATISDLEIGDASRRFSGTLDALSEQHTLGAVHRAIGSTSNPAVYGINLLLALPFFLMYFRVVRSLPARLFWLGGIGVVLYNLMLTNTRAVLLYMILLLGAAVATGLVRMNRFNVALGVVGVLALLAVLPESVWDRVLNPMAYEIENATNLSWRLDLWAAALRIGMEHWITGVGAGNMTTIIAYLDPTRFEGEWIAPHNEFLNKFMTMGVFGLTLFVLFLGMATFQAIWLIRVGAGSSAPPDRRWFATAALLSLVIGPAFGLQVDAFHFPLKGWWLVAGLVMVAVRLSVQENARRGAAGETGGSS